MSTREPSAASVVRCAKCGSDDILVRWHTGGRWGLSGCGYGAKVVGSGEHLHRTCRMCQYEWTETCADVAA